MRHTILYYVTDPMCSWCWGFHPVIDEIFGMLPEGAAIRYVMGGLAKDSDEPMSEEMKAYVKENWMQVAERTGASFNWDFWTKCTPRRSTYPACRAVLAASAQNTTMGPLLFHAIQRAYYLEARNPSDADTLIALAGEVGLDVGRFSADLVSPATELRLQKDFDLRRSLHADKFPSLLLETNDDLMWLAYGYEEPEVVLGTLEAALLA